MRNRDFKKVDWSFKDRFPPLENGKVYKFEDLADDWERAASLTVTEALTFGYADIIDLSVEIFGEIIPPNPNNFSWTHHFHYDLEIVKRLHDFGAEIEFLNKVGGGFNSTPLYASAYCGHIECVKYYLETGADPTIPNESGVSPIEAAYDNDNFEMVQLLASPRTINMKTFQIPELNIYEIAFNDKNTKYIELFEHILENSNKN